jgi:hypothetical protein
MGNESSSIITGSSDISSNASYSKISSCEETKRQTLLVVNQNHCPRAELVTVLDVRFWATYRKDPVEELWLYESPNHKQQVTSGPQPQHLFVLIRTNQDFWILEQDDCGMILSEAENKWNLLGWDERCNKRSTRRRCLLNSTSFESMSTLFRWLATELATAIKKQQLLDDDDDDDPREFCQRAYNVLADRPYVGDLHDL